ncbi:hypothetical protein BKG71_19455 [Mycobacteroides chelonae]|uniref:hypothetical protein n=1 Tax=Mycobacteroides chelonae TaxID=1774 RepID=UPI0008A92F15|nr:hypothetical protein [Mycobacteroides chelonae]OHT98295.1 hypothetical protein BKG71_19455 [Mycobacteroides chelonae]
MSDTQHYKIQLSNEDRESFETGTHLVTVEMSFRVKNTELESFFGPYMPSWVRDKLRLELSPDE